jgi:hypothetical protein
MHLFSGWTSKELVGWVRILLHKSKQASQDIFVGVEVLGHFIPLESCSPIIFPFSENSTLWNF